MRTILDVMPKECFSFDPNTGAVDIVDARVDMRVAGAYAALFTGTGSSEDAELVLVDLAQYARYYDTASLDMPADQVKALDQRRAVFQRIAEALTKSGKSLGDLHGAVLRSPPLD